LRLANWNGRPLAQIVRTSTIFAAWNCLPVTIIPPGK
jgi:hypothetical protein